MVIFAYRCRIGSNLLELESDFKPVHLTRIGVSNEVKRLKMPTMSLAAHFWGQPPWIARKFKLLHYRLRYSPLTRSTCAALYIAADFWPNRTRRQIVPQILSANRYRVEPDNMQRRPIGLKRNEA